MPPLKVTVFPIIIPIVTDGNSCYIAQGNDKAAINQTARVGTIAAASKTKVYSLGLSPEDKTCYLLRAPKDREAERCLIGATAQNI